MSFELEKREVTVAELDSLVIELKDARISYDLAKIVSNEKSGIVDEIEMKLIALLTEAGKSVYEVEGCARVTIVSKTQVTTPKSIEAKEAFFEWVEGRLGKEGLLAYQTVNYQSLNSLYNKEMERALEAGEEFHVPGLDLPMVVRTLQVRSR
jgi:hypothetical protein